MAKIGSAEELRVIFRAETEKAVKEILKTAKATDSAEKSLDKVSRASAKADKEFQRLAAGIGKAGSTLTRYFTAPVAGAAALMVKIASDAEETDSKFRVVFRDISNEAEAAVSRLTDAYDLSGVKAKQLLGDTGDLLSGFGFTQEAALDLSLQVQELAVDLASFTNYSGGAEGASEALTKALLGEREQIKSLGIAILEEDVQARMAANSAKGLRFETERQAKAYATLELAAEQSKNAIGDYARTSDSLSNQTRALQADLEDMSVEIGQTLIPLARDIVASLRDMIGGFSELDDESKKTILTLVGIGAAVGPTLRLASAVMDLGIKLKALDTAKLLSLLTSPVALALLGVAGVAAATAGIGAAVDKAHTERLKDPVERDNELRNVLNLAATTLEVYERIARSYGVQIDHVIALGEQMGRNVDTVRAEIQEREKLAALDKQQLAAWEHMEGKDRPVVEDAGDGGTGRDMTAFYEQLYAEFAQTQEGQIRFLKEKIAYWQEELKTAGKTKFEHEAILNYYLEQLAALEAKRDAGEEVEESAERELSLIERIRLSQAEADAERGEAARAYRSIQDQIQTAEASGDIEQILLLGQIAAELEGILGIKHRIVETDEEGAEKTERWKDAFKDLGDTALGSLDRIGEAIGRLARGSEDWADALSDVAGSLADAASSALIQSGTIEGIVAGGLIKLAKGIFSGLAGDGVSSADFSPVLDAEKLLSDERVRLVKETIDAERRLREEAIRKLDRQFSQEYEVLRDLWQRNLISTAEFESRVGALNTSTDTAREDVEQASADTLRPDAVSMITEALGRIDSLDDVWLSPGLQSAREQLKGMLKTAQSTDDPEAIEGILSQAPGIINQLPSESQLLADYKAHIEGRFHKGLVMLETFQEAEPFSIFNAEFWGQLNKQSEAYQALKMYGDRFSKDKTHTLKELREYDEILDTLSDMANDKRSWKSVEGQVYPFADGGIVTRPTIGLVGEAGPEAIIPLSRPGSALRQEVHFHFHGDIYGVEDFTMKVEAMRKRLVSRGMLN